MELPNGVVDIDDQITVRVIQEYSRRYIEEPTFWFVGIDFDDWLTIIRKDDGVWKSPDNVQFIDEKRQTKEHFRLSVMMQFLVEYLCLVPTQFPESH